MSIAKLRITIVDALQTHANPNISKGLSAYMKHAYQFRGLKSGTIVDCFKQCKPEIIELSSIDRFLLGIELMKSDFGEDKQIGILILGICDLDLERIKTLESLFIDSYIKDWSICDAFCGRVLKPWLNHSLQNTRYMITWSTHECEWFRRASCVGFITLCNKASKDQVDVMYQICLNVIQHQERFNQLGCGWLVRQLGVTNKARTIKFIEDNIIHFTAEGLSYATEKFSREEILYFRRLRKDNKSQFKTTNGNSQDEEAQHQIPQTQSRQNKSLKRRKEKAT